MCLKLLVLRFSYGVISRSKQPCNHFLQRRCEVNGGRSLLLCSYNAAKVRKSMLAPGHVQKEAGGRKAFPESG